MLRCLFVLLLLVPFGAHAQIITGTARVIDGDTLDLGGQRIRLHGIDAVEAQQTCNGNGEAWACGQAATSRLKALAQAKVVSCRQHDIDAYDRIVASCEVGRTDLAQVMIQSGLAVALPQYSAAYLEAEAMAKTRGVGIWSTQFDTPSDYRASHPSSHPTAKAHRSTSEGYASRQPIAVYYRNCAQARAAGAAPLYRGQPGYRPQMDGDGDGIACEPYRGRR